MKHTAIEPLEPRIAPAAITIAGKTATWTDFDGDIVTMKWTSAEAPGFTTNDRGDGLMVSRIVLDPAKHDGASFTISVKKGGIFGDGRVELWHVDGTGVAPKSWVGAKAAISELDLGNGTSGVGTLITGGIGQTKITDFVGSMGDGDSRIVGSTKLAKINGDIGYSTLLIGTNPTNSHGTIVITGNLRGDLPGGGSNDGRVNVNGKGTSVLIGGSIVNGSFTQSGADFKSIVIKGDIISDDPRLNGGIAGTQARATVIGGSIIGGNVTIAASQTSPNPVVTVGGSIIARDGVTDFNTGVLSVPGGTKSVLVKGSLLGANSSTWVDGSITGVPLTYFAGAIVCEAGSVGSITVGGSIYSGKIADFKPAVNGGIQIQGNVKSIAIGGSVLGRDRAPAYILAGGSGTGSTGDYNAIGKLSIKGDATHAFISAGTIISGDIDGNSDAHEFFTNPDSGIGSILIGGNFNTSNVFAGVKDGGSPGVNPTATGDTLDLGIPSLTAKIGPVVIKGHLLSERDAFYYSGFAADTIASITVNGRKVFTAGDGLRNFDDYITAREL